MRALDLGLVAAQLEGLEETIIHKLLDRAQFAANSPAYDPGASGFAGVTDRSLFDLRLRYQEEMDAVFGRYMVPEERPYHTNLPAPRREVTLPPTPLQASAIRSVNLTPRIVTHYLSYLPLLCREEHDGQYGSSVEHDVLAIQALGRRIHFGSLYVAESKFRADSPAFTATAERGDRSGLMKLITRAEVEERILERVREKVDYVQASVNTGVRKRVDPEVVLRLYRDAIIPLTKEGQIDYLLARVAGTG